jgi:hypothetical protein
VRVDFSPWCVPESFGTADFVAIADDTLHVVENVEVAVFPGPTLGCSVSRHCGSWHPSSWDSIRRNWLSH